MSNRRNFRGGGATIQEIEIEKLESQLNSLNNILKELNKQQSQLQPRDDPHYYQKQNVIAITKSNLNEELQKLQNKLKIARLGYNINPIWTGDISKLPTTHIPNPQHPSILRSIQQNLSWRSRWLEIYEKNDTQNKLIIWKDTQDTNDLKGMIELKNATKNGIEYICSESDDGKNNTLTFKLKSQKDEDIKKLDKSLGIN